MVRLSFIYIAVHNSNYKGLKRQVKGLAQIFIAVHHNWLVIANFDLGPGRR